MAPGGWQERIELGNGLRRRFCEGAAAADQHVGGENARTARVGHKGEPGSLGARLLGKHLGHVEQLSDRFNPQDTHPAESCLQHLIAPGEGSGMGGCRLGCGLGPADLDDYDGLCKGDLPCGRKERPGIPDGLHVDYNALGVGVIAQIVNEVAPIHIEHGSDGDE